MPEAKSRAISLAQRLISQYPQNADWSARADAYRARAEALRRKVTGALQYPAFVLLAASST